MAESAVSTAAKWIGKVGEEVKYLDQVTENMEELQSELEWMLCFLQDADQQRYRNAVVQKWVAQIKEHAYDAEDLIDKYMVKVSERTRDNSHKLISKKTLVRYLCIVQDWYTLRGVGSEMDSLTLKISKLAERLQRYGVQVNKGIEDCMLRDKSTRDEQRKTYAQDPTEDFIIGIEDDIKLLTTTLLDDDKKVIAVIGMGGLGKTTIARQVYNQLKDGDSNHFVSFSWVHISKKFNTEKLWETILKELTEDLEEHNDVKILKDKKDFKSAIYLVMLKRNCLVVIDDVWSMADFCKLHAAFPKEVDMSGSRVLLTSRNESTIQGLESLVYAHRPEGLKGDDIMNLFSKKFGKLPDDKEKKELLNEMLDHCGGVPLAISALAAVLKRKQKVEEWEAVRYNMGFYLGAVEDPDQPYQNVYDVLGTSYSDLPPHLKPCFLHLANFPEDYQIETDVLFKLWLAEGLVTLPIINGSLVNKKHHRHLEEQDIAYAYLNELAARSMIQIIERDSSSGRIKTCQLHDLMLDVCLSTAIEEGFVDQVEDIYVNHHITTRTNSTSRRTTVVAMHATRRLAVHLEHHEESSSSSSSSQVVMKILISSPGLRSLIFFPIGELRRKEDCSSLVIEISEGFPLLRVLEFKDNQISGIMPKKLGRLIHLRYLGLRNTLITKLPSSTANLKYLQTLDLRVGGGIVISLPNKLYKLKLLRHLYLPELQSVGGKVDKAYNIQGGKALSLYGLTHMETLWNVALDDTDGLHSLVQMKSLKGFLMGNLEALDPFIVSESMKEVTLWTHPQVIMEDSNRVLSRTVLVYASIQVTQDEACEPISFLRLDTGILPQTISSLHFLYITFNEDPMPILGQLKNLRALEFHICFGCEGLKCSKGSFPELTYLLLGRFWDLEWEVEQGALPRLDRIHMYNTNFLIAGLPETIPPSVWVTCSPCVPGLETRERPCPYAS